jgi:succinate dehydrogenase flavin-adding protein (antitoxin of CptAB toxin-antitoxin module)
MKSIVFVVAFFIPTLLYSQYSTKKGNSFPNGVYLSIDELKTRQPTILISQILLNDEPTENVKKWFRGDSLFFRNNQHVKSKISYDSVFAFVDDGVLYIQRKGFDHKVTVPGQLCYFVESYPTRRAASAPVVMDKNNETIPRILDLQDGEIFEYSVKSLEEILALRDEELFQEFIGLKNPKKQRQVLLRFIERYNDRHPMNNSSL